jgi:hypothetical protein
MTLAPLYGESALQAESVIGRVAGVPGAAASAPIIFGPSSSLEPERLAGCISLSLPPPVWVGYTGVTEWVMCGYAGKLMRRLQASY